jgi:iron(III) transport system substrate-binding protein
MLQRNRSFYPLSIVCFILMLCGCTPNESDQTSTDSTQTTQVTSTTDQVDKSIQNKSSKNESAQKIDHTLILYSGRKLSLIRPLLKIFENEYKIQVKTRQDSSTTLANLLIQEGEQSTADVFWSQDPEAMAMVEEKNLLAKNKEASEKDFNPAFAQLSSHWLASSGRLRVLAYHTERAKNLPKSIFDLVKPRYKGRVGWAPSNASFQTFVTAMRLQHGENKAKAWLQGMMKNEAKKYPKNTPIITALDAGEIDYGLPNHYYLLQAQSQGRAKKLAQTAFKDGDVGNLMSVAAIAVLKASKNPNAHIFVDFIVSQNAQTYFAQKIKEYPIHKDVKADETLAKPNELKRTRAQIDLKQLKDRKGSIKLLREVGLL